MNSTDTVRRCGCGGTIEPGKGCLLYLDSEEHVLDTDHEGRMRAGGLGFGVWLDNATAMMSMHLQVNGLKHEETVIVLEKAIKIV